jgi:hypothetical protein
METCGTFWNFEPPSMSNGRTDTERPRIYRAEPSKIVAAHFLADPDEFIHCAK